MALLLGKITPKIRQAAEDPKKKQKKQLIILAAVVFLIVIVLLWGFSGGGDIDPEFGGLNEVVADIKSSGRGDNVFNPSFYQADRAFLDGTVFKNLKVFGNHPIVAGELGVENPFVSE